MSSIDQQFVEFIVKSLVGNPEAVQIERRIDEKGVLLELTVDPEDLGRIIGKRGATAQSLRTLLRALGTKNDARYNLKIIDNGPLDESRNGHREDNRDDNRSEPRNDSTVAPAQNSNNDGHGDGVASPAPAASSATAQDDDNEDELGVEAGTSTSDVVSKARKELADLDDLDI